MSPSSTLRASEVGAITLRLTSPDGRQKNVRIKSGTCTVGRGERSTLRLRSPGVEATHCRITREQSRCTVRRVAENTRLNGRPFTTSDLRVGDELTVGPWKIELLEVASPAVEPVLAGASKPPGDPDPRSQDKSKSAEVIEDLRAQLAQLQQQRRAWQHEYAQRELEGTRQQHELNQRLQEAAEQHRQLEQLRGQWNEEIKRARGGLETLELRLDEELREIEQQRQDLARRREAWQTEWDRGRVRQLQWQKQLDERLEELETASTSAQQRGEGLRRLTSDLEKKSETLDHELDRLRGLRESLLAELQGWRNECEKQQATLDSHLDRADKRRAAMESDAVEIAKLKKQWEDATGQLDGELRGQVDRVESQLAQLQSESSDAAKTRDEWLQQQRAARLELESRAEQIDERLRLVDERLNGSGEQHAALIKRFERLADSHEELRQQLESAAADQPWQTDFEQLQSTVGELREQLAGGRGEWQSRLQEIQQRQEELQARAAEPGHDGAPRLERLQTTIEQLGERADGMLKQQQELAAALQQQNEQAAVRNEETRRALEELRNTAAAPDPPAAEQTEARFARLEAGFAQLVESQQAAQAERLPWESRLNALEQKLAAAEANAADADPAPWQSRLETLEQRVTAAEANPADPADAAWQARIEALEHALTEMRLEHESLLAQPPLPPPTAPATPAVIESSPGMTMPVGGDFQPAQPDEADEAPAPESPPESSPNITAPVGGDFQPAQLDDADEAPESPPSMTVPVGGDFQPAQPDDADEAPESPPSMTVPVGGDFQPAQPDDADEAPESPLSMTVPVGGGFQPAQLDDVDAVAGTVVLGSGQSLIEQLTDRTDDALNAGAQGEVPLDEESTSVPTPDGHEPVEKTIEFEAVASESPGSTTGLFGALEDVEDDQHGSDSPLAESEPESAIEPPGTSTSSGTTALGQADPFSPKGSFDPIVPPATQPEAESAGGEDETIESYMANLLARVRTSAPPGPAPKPAPAPPPPPEPLKPESYQPRSAAAEKNADLTTLRDLANTTARTAINTHSRHTINTRVRSKLVISLVALGFSLAFMWFSTSEGWVLYSASVVSLLVAIISGFRYLHLSSVIASASAIEAAQVAAGQHPDGQAAADTQGAAAALPQPGGEGAPHPPPPGPQPPPTATAEPAPAPTMAPEAAAPPDVLPRGAEGGRAEGGENQPSAADVLEQLASPGPLSAPPGAPEAPEAAPPAEGAGGVS